MRIISQDGMVDMPYDGSVLDIIPSDSYVIILCTASNGVGRTIGKYPLEKAQDVCRMILSAQKRKQMVFLMPQAESVL